MSNGNRNKPADPALYEATLDNPELVDEILRGKNGVGYGRPPLDKQFKPGQSGNPKGRPKGTRNLRSALEKILTDSISIREGARVRKVTRLEAVLLTNIKKALEGDHKASAAINATAKALGLVGPPQPEPQSYTLITKDLSGFSTEELAEFLRLLEKAQASCVPN